MAWIGGNRYLSQSEMLNNAKEIYNVLGSTFSLNSLSAMIGNMRTESFVNPNIWENLEPQTDPTVRRGYGLVQWTPWGKLKSWCDASGLNYTDGNAQCLRIIYELNNNIQWGGNLYNNYPNTPPYDFYGFSCSTEPLETLTLNFTIFYERPRESEIEKWRQTKLDFAKLVYEELSGMTPPGPEPPRPAPPRTERNRHYTPPLCLYRVRYKKLRERRK